MKQKYPYIFKIICSLIAVFLAFLIPISSVKVVLGIIAIIIFSFNLRKYTVFFITFIILFFLTSLFMTNFTTNFQKSSDFMNEFFRGTVQLGYNLNERGYDYSYEENLKILRADEKIPMNKNIEIKGVNFNIYFDKESDVIEIPEELSYEIEDGVLKIFYDGDWRNKRADISIGTENTEYENLVIESVILDIKGNLVTKKLKVNSTNTKIHLELIANNFDIDSTTAKLDGEFVVDFFNSNNTNSDYRINFEGYNFNMNSTNVDLRGIFKTEELNIEAVDVAANLSVENTDFIKINSNVSNLDIKYLDLWKGKRTLDLKSEIGKAKVGVKDKMKETVKESTENYGELVINTEGKIIVERYTFFGY